MHSSTPIALFLLCLVVRCHGYSTFTTNCSIPSDSVNFVSSPDTRGTLDIVFSCLFTILVCTWSIQHLNVPEQRVVKRAAVGTQTDLEMESEPDQTADESRRGRVRRRPAKTDGFWSDFRWSLKGLWRNVKWMLFTIVAPEFIFGKALADFVAARESCEVMKSLAEFDGVQWGLEHGFYVNMGGFVGFEQNDKDQVPDEVKAVPLSAEHIYLLRTTKAGTNERLDVSDIVAGRAQFKTGIERLPDITIAEIQEKSQSNLFVKVVTLFQVSGVILQVIVRASKGLSVSLLELSVVAFSSCAIIIYIVLLYKPQGIQIPTRIICEHGSISNAISSIVVSWFPMRYNYNPFATYEERDLEVHKRIPNDFIGDSAPFEGVGVSIVLVGVMLGSAIFGGIHVAGWNLKFPTSTEQTLWRISSLLVTILLPISAWGMFTLSPRVRSITGIFFLSRRFSGLYAWNLLSVMLYFFARLFMLIEIIRTLFYLPPDSYISTWASYVPHIS